MQLAAFLQEWHELACTANDLCTKPKCEFGLRYGANFVEILTKAEIWPLYPHRTCLKNVLLAMQQIGFEGVMAGCKEHDFDCYPMPSGDPLPSGEFYACGVKGKEGVMPLCIKCFQKECDHGDDLGAFTV